MLATEASVRSGDPASGICPPRSTAATRGQIHRTVAGPCGRTTIDPGCVCRPTSSTFTPGIQGMIDPRASDSGPACDISCSQQISHFSRPPSGFHMVSESISADASFLREHSLECESSAVSRTRRAIAPRRTIAEPCRRERRLFLRTVSDLCSPALRCVAFHDLRSRLLVNHGRDSLLVKTNLGGTASTCASAYYDKTYTRRKNGWASADARPA